MSTTDRIPPGRCQCGCGAPTGVILKNSKSAGLVKGERFRYVRGHQRRRQTFDLWRVEDRGHDTPCWIWTGRVAHGYGQLQRDGRKQQAHRYFYEQAHGPLPRGHALELHHDCEIKDCVNPAHLRVLPAAEHRREHSSSATWDVVDEVRRRAVLQGVTRQMLADESGLSLKQIRDIVAGRTWRKE